MKRKLLIAATLATALAALATIVAVGAPRTCPTTEHCPMPAKPGTCKACRGRTAMLQPLCGGCAKRQGRCKDCGEKLQSGLGTIVSRLFEGP